MRSGFVVAFGAALLAGSGVSQAAGPDDEAKTVLAAFAKPGADHAALSNRLRPTKADYVAVFAPAVAGKLQATYDPAWDKGAIVVRGKAGQTEIHVWGAASADVKAWTPQVADHFAGGWKDVAPHVNPGFRIYTFQFVEPGQSLGMSFDGLVKVGGQWRIFPKPWRALR